MLKSYLSAAAIATLFWVQWGAMSPDRAAAQSLLDPPKSGAPRATIGGGVRGNCSANQTATFTEDSLLMPLVPANGGLTAANLPTVLVYVPQTNAKTVTFALENPQGQLIYEGKTLLSGAPGILTFMLPANFPALEIGQDYRWFVSLNCDTTEVSPSKNPTVGGSIRRVVASAPDSLWYDTVSELANQRRSNPNNSQSLQAWSELLRSVGLGRFATAPLHN